MVPPQGWMQFVFIIRSYLCFRELTSGSYQGSTNTIAFSTLYLLLCAMSTNMSPIPAVRLIDLCLKREVPLKQNVSTKPTHWVVDHYSTDGLYVFVVLTVLMCWLLRLARPLSFRVEKFCIWGIQTSSFVTHFWLWRNKYLMTATWELGWL